MTKHAMMILSAAALIFLSGCKRAAPQENEHAANRESEPKAQAAAPTNRVDIPAAVRKNLGITFATVERRAVSKTLRLPGRFELSPTARREHRAAAGGRVDLVVSPFDRVKVGDLLFRLDSPRWRELQESIAGAESSLMQAKARSASIGPLLAAHQDHERRLREKTDLWTTRLAQLDSLRSIGGGQQSAFTEAKTSLTDAEADLADAVEKGAELAARRLETQAELAASESRFLLLLDIAESLTGVPAAQLRSASSEGVTEQALWRTLRTLEIRAVAPGVVEDLHVTNGAIVDASELVLSTVQPDQLRFRATALQADLGRLRDGLAARIVPPSGGGVAVQDALPGIVTLGLRADPDGRTLDLIVKADGPSTWSRAGVAAHLEVTLEGGEEELAIPLSCVTRDGTRPIIFRRDPSNPDRAIRMDADVGVSDGRWVVIASGVKEGDEIVLDGVYQLMLATAGNAPKGGHFHSDGTFHEGEDH